ncbi:cartilage intermediate layer protein 2-like [Hemibagrus wyckioides]|uniref:cartilage intermediate layer protein 2-like n=1 Tax=Hemibagrus wyckioides TaxID=337641 RepID=UPI00266C450C|nr:cartilage intermediate layer protein 2-like [Hemibagrus wyckioides]
MASKIIFGVFLILVIGLVPEIQAIPPKFCFTQWFNRDNPGGSGDYEILDRLRVEYPGKICSKPLSIEARTLSGVLASQTEQVFAYYNTVHGFACVNNQQVNGRCMNYKVRFRCLCPWPQ